VKVEANLGFILQEGEFLCEAGALFEGRTQSEQRPNDEQAHLDSPWAI
jgi:hypothetical protein